ncbi:MAG TPA: hypothetical protein G4O04_08240 [Anaerolineae bacterium]|nr:hypothetical protein [Anaerolineae bacterium]HID85135.1 hypothetical protein [Anaerolineales bacterium]HIQ08457.1 hypothetical protein [Anaerolineaceae bacterium]
MDRQTLELWFWTAFDALVLHLRQLRLTILTWALNHGLLELPAPPWWLWATLPLLVFGLGIVLGILLSHLA